MRDIHCDLQARANLLKQQISDENAQFERAILQLKTKLDSNLQHLRAQLRLANKLIEFSVWHDNLRANLAAEEFAVAEATEMAVKEIARRRPLILWCFPNRPPFPWGYKRGRCFAVHLHAPHAVSIREAMMAESATLILEMIDDQIVVTMPGTNFWRLLASGRARPSSSPISCKTTGTLPCPARSSLRAPGDLRLPKRESFAGSR